MDGNILRKIINKGVSMSINWTEKNIDTGDLRCMLSGISMSSNGEKMAICANGNYIYTSNDTGSTWTTQTSFGKKNWAGISSSSDGNKLSAICNKYNFSMNHQPEAEQESYVCTSVDGGVNWTTQTNSGNKNWAGIASSSNGNILVACSIDNYISISNDSGLTWSDNTSSGIKQWRSISISADGSKIIAICVNPPNAHVSTDSGLTWTDLGSNIWSGASISPNGNIFGACVDNNQNGYVYTSTNGTDWTSHEEVGARWWDKLTFNQDGSKVFVIHHNDNMFIGDIS